MADIVICDDEPHITRAVEVKLKRAGHSVRAGFNGAEALAFVRERRPDMIITDCQMPVMTGIQLCQALRADAQLAGVPVLMVTAKGLEICEDDLRRQLGVSRLLFKPFSPRQLVEAVEEHLMPAVAAAS